MFVCLFAGVLCVKSRGSPTVGWEGSVCSHPTFVLTVKHTTAAFISQPSSLQLKTPTWGISVKRFLVHLDGYDGCEASPRWSALHSLSVLARLYDPSKKSSVRSPWVGRREWEGHVLFCPLIACQLYGKCAHNSTDCFLEIYSPLALEVKWHCVDSLLCPLMAPTRSAFWFSLTKISRGQNALPVEPTIPHLPAWTTGILKIKCAYPSLFCSKASDVNRAW